MGDPVPLEIKIPIAIGFVLLFVGPAVRKWIAKKPIGDQWFLNFLGIDIASVAAVFSAVYGFDLLLLDGHLFSITSEQLSAVFAVGLAFMSYQTIKALWQHLFR